MVRRKNQGAAMIVAMVVGVVLMAFALSLLAVSYSLFSSASQRTTQLQCRELARSIDRELQRELTEPNYATYAKQKEDEGKKNNLWFFVRYNLGQSNSNQSGWPYYKEGEVGHSKEDSSKYFTMDASDDSELQGWADEISICLYWEIDDSIEGDVASTESEILVGEETGLTESEALDNEDATSTESGLLAGEKTGLTESEALDSEDATSAESGLLADKDNKIILHTVIKIQRGDSSYTLDTPYRLSVDGQESEKQDDEKGVRGYTDVKYGEKDDSYVSEDINPNKNSIFKKEKWTWSVD
jgi:hypothetical protein